MQLEKAKETKQDMERCRLLAQRIAEELAPATAAVLNAETRHWKRPCTGRAWMPTPLSVAARQADLLVVGGPRLGGDARAAARTGAAGVYRQQRG